MRLKMSSNDRYACSAENSMRCFLAIRLMSQFLGNLCRFNRKYSRTIRLILFLWTAGPTFFVTVMPIRDRPCWLGANTAIKCSFWNLRPFSDRAIKSFRFKILSAFVREKRTDKHPTWLSINLISFPDNFQISTGSRSLNLILTTSHTNEAERRTWSISRLVVGD